MKGAKLGMDPIVLAEVMNASTARYIIIFLSSLHYFPILPFSSLILSYLNLSYLKSIFLPFLILFDFYSILCQMLEQWSQSSLPWCAEERSSCEELWGRLWVRLVDEKFSNYSSSHSVFITLWSVDYLTHPAKF